MTDKTNTNATDNTSINLKHYEKLPRTADNIPIYPGMTIYLPASLSKNKKIKESIIDTIYIDPDEHDSIWVELRSDFEYDYCCECGKRTYSCVYGQLCLYADKELAEQN